MHNPQEEWKITKSFHLSRWFSSAMLHHHPFILLHLQHCAETTREAQQIRHNASVKKQTQVFPQQKRFAVDDYDAGDFLVLHRVLLAVDGRECLR